jgi:hypothetical protein
MTNTKSISPLRQRMIDDMRMRKMQPETRDAYVRSVKRLAEFLRRSPDTGNNAKLTASPSAAAPRKRLHRASGDAVPSACDDLLLRSPTSSVPGALSTGWLTRAI